MKLNTYLDICIERILGAYKNIMLCARTKACGWSELFRRLTVVFKHSIELTKISDRISIFALDVFKNKLSVWKLGHVLKQIFSQEFDQMAREELLKSIQSELHTLESSESFKLLKELSCNQSLLIQ